MLTDVASSPKTAAHYRGILADGEEGGGLETTESTRGSDLSAPALRERVRRARAELRRIVKRHLGDDPALLRLADKIARDGELALQAVANDDDARLLAQPELLASLEVIVRTDGSRPSFLVRNGEVDRTTSPVGSWGSTLDVSDERLSDAAEGVGRIDDPNAEQGFDGTGFLVGDDVILTNRHVLQEIASRENGSWKIRRGMAIDFGHEFRARKSVNRRKLKRVLFAGSKPILTNTIHHDRLDLALIELEPAPRGTPPRRLLSLDAAPDWASLQQTVFIIGYPGSPQPGSEAFSLLEQLFQATFGYKRLAPGRVIKGLARLPDWGLAHDATTLGGNSGSVLLVVGREFAAAGLHYGGTRAQPRENWGHVLGAVLSEKDPDTSQSLADCLTQHGVNLMNRTVTPTGRKPASSAPATPRVTERTIRTRIHRESESERGERPSRSGADLGRKASLAAMIRLNGDGGLTETLEKAGKEPTTPAEEFDGRNGYDAAFLDGWEIPLPKVIGARARDVRKLRRGGAGSELKYRNFSVVLSASRRMPMITACNIDGEESRRLPRIQTWSFDGRLDKADQWGDALYDSNLLDRGHMVRREDPVWGKLAIAREANADTFHFTNSCPQMAGVNQRTWVGLENYVLSHARTDAMRVSVFTGPYFSKKDLPYRDALVPLRFWKVVAIVTDDGRPSATAYRVSQERELEDLEFVYAGYKTFQISIRQVTEETGIDFGDLVEYDGFSEHERTTGERMEEKLDSLTQIRV